MKRVERTESKSIGKETSWILWTAVSAGICTMRTVGFLRAYVDYIGGRFQFKRKQEQIYKITKSILYLCVMKASNVVLAALIVAQMSKTVFLIYVSGSEKGSQCTAYTRKKVWKIGFHKIYFPEKKMYGYYALVFVRLRFFETLTSKYESRDALSSFLCLIQDAWDHLLDCRYQLQKVDNLLTWLLTLRAYINTTLLRSGSDTQTFFIGSTIRFLASIKYFPLKSTQFNNGLERFRVSGMLPVSDRSRALVTLRRRRAVCSLKVNSDIFSMPVAYRWQLFPRCIQMPQLSPKNATLYLTIRIHPGTMHTDGKSRYDGFILVHRWRYVVFEPVTVRRCTPQVRYGWTQEAGATLSLVLYHVLYGINRKRLQ